MYQYSIVQEMNIFQDVFKRFVFLMCITYVRIIMTFYLKKNMTLTLFLS